MARNGCKMAILWVNQVQKNIFAFCVITFEPIKILNCLAPQNDGLNLSFVKDIKCPEMVKKRQLVQAGGGGYQ